MDYYQTVFVQRILDFAHETLQRHILHDKRFSKFSLERKYVLSDSPMNFFQPVKLSLEEFTKNQTSNNSVCQIITFCFF